MCPLNGLGNILGLYTSACSDVMRDVLHYFLIHDMTIEEKHKQIVV
uniref:Uncharacterized protein n=1 Tax=Arundo donax TaxID=35708 RepID=A0A0A9APZ4_ARUDO